MPGPKACGKCSWCTDPYGYPVGHCARWTTADVEAANAEIRYLNARWNGGNHDPGDEDVKR